MADFRDYIGMDTSTFLMHYGRGHLDGGKSGRFKWGSGERPFQRTSMEGNRSKKEAKQYQKKLRKLERRRTYLQAHGKATALQGDKYNKRLSVEWDDELGNVVTKPNAKLEAKRKQKYSEAARMISDANDVKKQIEATITELTDKGYDIHSKEYKRYVSGTEDYVAALLGGAIGAITVMLAKGKAYTVPSNKYKVEEPKGDNDQKATVKEAKAKEKKLLNEYFDASEKFEAMSKDDPEWESARRDMKAKEKAANNAMVERAKAQHPNEPDEKIAKRLGFPVEEVRSASKSEKYGGIFGKSKKQKQRERDEAWDKEVQKTIDEMSKGSEADKAWARYLEFDKSTVKNSYKNQEDYDRDSGKAFDEYFKIKKQENNARDKSKMPTSNGLTESQRKAFNQAKNEDKWSIDFLEVADPDNEWSDQKMLREYKEYLKDPEGWMTRR